MKHPQSKKIEALEKTIYNLENNLVKYDWQDFESCNCGVLAKTILDGKSLYAAGYCKSPSKDLTLSPFAINAYCMTTGLSLPEVFQALKDTGFSHDDLLGLENLSSSQIIKRLGWETYDHSGRYYVVHRGHSRIDKADVISYLKAWVEILKEEIPAIQPIEEKPIEKPTRQYTVVKVSESILDGEVVVKNIKETVLN